jgi:hypothetical protein
LEVDQKTNSRAVSTRNMPPLTANSVGNDEPLTGIGGADASAIGEDVVVTTLGVGVGVLVPVGVDD